MNNTIVLGNATTSAAFRAFDGIDSVEMHNNALFRLGGGPVTVLRDAEASWKAGRVVGGTKNWVTSGSSAIPGEWTATASGSSCGFINVAGRDVHLASGSGLVNIGVSSTMSPAGHPFPNPLPLPSYEPPLHVVNAAAVSRTIVSAIDVGAYELAGTASAPSPAPSSTSPAPSSSSPPPPPPPSPSGTTLTLAPLADSYVEASSASTNFGSATVLFAAANSTLWYNDDSYLKFDVSAASTVTSAKLRIRAALTATSGGALTLAVYPVADTSWTESGLTYANRPALGSSPLSSASVTTDSYVTYELDVTSYVAAQRAAGQGTVTLGLHTPSAAGTRILMQSRESGSGPSLVVTH